MTPPAQQSHMERALEEAQRAGERNEVPIGAVIVDNSGRIVASAGNETRANNDPTAHAEIVVIREACKLLNAERLINCDIFVTLEPCAMCAAAISFARIRRLYYGASDPKGGAVESGSSFFSQSTCHHTPDIYPGLGQAQSAQLLRDFFKQRRSHNLK